MDFHLNLNTETVGPIVTSDPLQLEPSAKVRDAFLVMKERRRGAVLVCKDGKLVGIFTERDALRMMAAGADLDGPLEEAMTRDPVTTTKNDTVGEAIAKMSNGGYRRLPLVNEEGHPQGFVKVAGILHYLVQHFPSVVYNLPPSPHPSSTQEREGA